MLSSWARMRWPSLRKNVSRDGALLDLQTYHWDINQESKRDLM